jgi:hypothetical protein
MEASEGIAPPVLDRPGNEKVGAGAEKPYDETMEFGFILLLIFVAAPIARGVARAIERRGLPADRSAEEVKKTLQLTEQRLSDSEARLAALEERVDFYERLLANPDKKRESLGA